MSLVPDMRPAWELREHLKQRDDTITALRAENEKLKEWNREIALNAREFAAENERLRAALAGHPQHGAYDGRRSALAHRPRRAGGEAMTIIDERQKTHGDYYRTAGTAQEMKDVLRRGKNWKTLDDTERETLEMIATKIGRILSGNPHEVDHWRDIAGYATLIERWITLQAGLETKHDR